MHSLDCFWEKRENVGGQAVIEGVMIRSKYRFAVAVRRKDGSIVLWSKPWNSIFSKYKLFDYPFVRGGVILIETLREGLSALKFSAEQMEEDMEEKEEKKESFTLAIILGVVLGLVFFKGVPHLTAYILGKLLGYKTDMTSFLFHVVDGVVKIILFISYIVVISLFKDIKRVFMYHGAEHKSIYAYERKGEISIEEAKKHPRVHPRCGTSFIIFVIIISILLYSFILPFIPPLTYNTVLNHLIWVVLKIVLLVPIASITYEFNRWAGSRITNRFVRFLAYPGLLLQYITTKEPDDSQLEVALVALGSVLKDKSTEEKKIRFANFEDFFIKYNKK